MPAERTDTIAAGAIVVRTALELLHARMLIVSGEGLREGLAYEAFRAGEPALIDDPRRAGIDAFRERYVTGLRTFARHYAGESSDSGTGNEPSRPVAHPSDGVVLLTARLFEQLAPAMDPADRDRDLLEAAAALCDAGRAVSLYRWPEHAVYLLTNGDLSGFTQHEAVIVGEAIASQEGQRIDLERYGVSLPESEVVRAGRLGAIVGIARWLRRIGVEHSTPMSVLTLDGQIVIVLPPETPLIQDDWRDGLERGCRRYFGRELRFARLGD